VKEAAARIKINKLLIAAGWRFFASTHGPANVQLESSVNGLRFLRLYQKGAAAEPGTNHPLRAKNSNHSCPHLGGGEV